MRVLRGVASLIVGDEVIECEPARFVDEALKGRATRAARTDEIGLEALAKVAATCAR